MICSDFLQVMYIYFCPHHAAWGNLSSMTRDRNHAPAMEAQSLNRWTTREVPEYFNKNTHFNFCGDNSQPKDISIEKSVIF